MAMERLRAQIMQQDQSGVYRTNTSNPGASMRSPVSPTATSRAMNSWTLNENDRSEASATDHYGHPRGFPIGQIFENRMACMVANVHKANVKGIVGNSTEGATSIVVNDGYEDDIDEGDIIWYTGAGGQGTRHGESQPQKTDQSFEHTSNLTLWKNTVTKHPVRVIRGSKDSKWGPRRGYRYDGLYDVLSAEYATGKSGYRICRFKLQRRTGQVPLKDLPRA